MVSPAMFDKVSRAIFIPGGVVDADGGTAYLSSKAGGIDAVELAGGTALWHTDRATLPLLGLHGAVVAAAPDESGALLLHVLRRQDGAVLLSSAKVTREPNTTWQFQAARLDGDVVLVRYQTERYQHPRGAPVLGPLPEAPKTAALGFDLETGTVAQRSPADFDEPVPALPPGAPELTLFRDTSGWARPFRSGDLVAALAAVPEDDDMALFLYTWSADGSPRPRRELFPQMPKEGFLTHHRSPDDAHVFLLRCNDAPEGGLPPGYKCAWWVFEVATGKELGVVPNEYGTESPMAVVGGRLFFIRSGRIPNEQAPPQRALWCVDLATGGLVWARPVPSMPITALP